MIIDANLIIPNPGALAGRLKKLATFRRQGRVPPGEQRVIPYYRIRPEGLYLPRGLLPQVQALAPVAVEDRRLRLQPVDFGWRGRLRPYQWRAVREVLLHGGGLVDAPPGAGKTVLGMALIAAWRQPALWLVNSKDLAEQAIRQAATLFHLPRGAVQYIGGGEGLQIGSHLTVAMIASLHRHPRWVRTLAGRVGVVVTDEAHHDAALTWARIITHFPAAVRLGLSATLDRGDGLGLMVAALMGQHVTRVDEGALIRTGFLVPPTIRLVPTGFSWHEGADWNELDLARAQDPSRNYLLCQLAAGEFKAGRRTLILVTRKPHAYYLARALRRQWNVPAVALTGAVPKMTRQLAFARIMERPLVIVATKLANEGLDLPALDRLILGAAGRSGTQTRQQVGRVMRAWTGKSQAVVYDLVDLQHTALREQYQERLRVYQERGWRIERQPG